MKVDVPRILERIFNSRYYEIDVTDLPLVDLAKAPFMVKVQDGKARFLVFAYDECEAYSRVFSFIDDLLNQRYVSPNKTTIIIPKNTGGSI